MSTVARLESPCIGVCTLDETGRACLGCCRTTDEIAVWVVLDHDERARIIGELAERRRRRDGSSLLLEPRQCSRCGTRFGCGAGDPHNACWCSSYPPIRPDAAMACLCPACLAAAANKE